MGNRVFVVGVGMTKFEKPGARELGLPRHGQRGRRQGTRGRRDRVRARGAGVRRLRVRRIDVGTPRRLRARHDRHSRSPTSTTTARPGRPRSTSPRRRSAAGRPTARSRWASRRCSPARSAPTYDDREQPMMRHLLALAETSEFAMPPAPYMFGAAGREHMERYGTTAEQFAKIGLKNHRHSVNNPYAQFQDEYTLEEILARRRSTGRSPNCSAPPPPTAPAPRSSPARSSSTSTTSPTRPSRSSARPWSPTSRARSRPERDQPRRRGHDRTAAARVYDQAGIGPDDVDVIELHDCFSTNELLTYEALGLCGEGEGGKLVDNDDTTYGGRWVVNPSGGLISKGHPSAPPASPSAPNSPGSCAAPPTSARSTAPRSPSSTTSASAAPSSSPPTSAP